MFDFEAVPGVIRVPLAHPFDRFFVLVIPNIEEGENGHDFYLGCAGFSLLEYMFGVNCESQKHLVEIAHQNGINYIDINNYK